MIHDEEMKDLQENIRTIRIGDLSELLLIDRLLDNWKNTARKADSDFATGYALHDRVRAALKEMLNQ